MCFLESRAIRALNEFQQRCAQCIEEIQVEEMVRRDIQMLLDHYNGFITFDNYSDGDECLCCGQEEQLIRVGLHGDVKYDPNLLIIQDTVDEETFGHSMVSFILIMISSNMIMFRTLLYVKNVQINLNSIIAIDTHCSICIKNVKIRYTIHILTIFTFDLIKLTLVHRLGTRKTYCHCKCIIKFGA